MSWTIWKPRDELSQSEVRRRAVMGFQGEKSKAPSPWSGSRAAPPAKRGESFVTMEGDRYIVRTTDAEVAALVRTYAAKTGKTVTTSGDLVVLDLPADEGKLLRWPQQILSRLQFGQQQPEVSGTVPEGKSVQIIGTKALPSPFGVSAGEGDVVANAPASSAGSPFSVEGRVVPENLGKVGRFSSPFSIRR